MRKFIVGIKDRLSISDPPGSNSKSESVAAPPPLAIPSRPYRRFPDTEDMYKHRKQRGVNLGSWFVLERWITESPFQSAREPAQSDLDVALGDNARSILEQHWDTWITDGDWEWLADKGINTVRIPIGYYHICGIDPSVLNGTDFADLYESFAGAWSRITSALATAHRYGIGVLFDLHAAPGKQNADSHSGTSSEPTFFGDPQKMSHTIHILTSFVGNITAFARAHNPPLANLVGVELLNEPQQGPHNEGLKQWYLQVFNAIRCVDPELPLYISDSWMTEHYTEFIKTSGKPFLALDHHLYRCFTGEDISTPVSEHARRLFDPNEGTPQLFARVAQDLEGAGGALVVGEWSAALNPGSLHGISDERAEKNAFVRAQLQLYNTHCAGWFFWAYKKEHGGDTGWSFRDAVESGVFPGDFAPYRVGLPAEDEMGIAREHARGTAFEQHRSHWAQYPGHYERQRFYDGFNIGWGDAMLFASWSARDTSQHVQELGFKGPWLKRRTHEHVTYRGSGNVWEFEHGFLQGFKAGHEYAMNRG